MSEAELEDRRHWAAQQALKDAICDMDSRFLMTLERLNDYFAERDHDWTMNISTWLWKWSFVWFIWHHADHALQELVHFSAELWGWDEELFNIELDRDCWVTFNAVELPDYFEPPIGTRGSQRRPVAAVLGYDAGDGV